MNDISILNEDNIVPILILVAIAVIQIIICVVAKKLWIRLIPAYLIIIAIAFSLLFTYGVIVEPSDNGWGQLFQAFFGIIFLVISLLGAAADLVGWGLYGIGHLIHKKKHKELE